MIPKRPLIWVTLSFLAGIIAERMIPASNTGILALTVIVLLFISCICFPGIRFTCLVAIFFFTAIIFAHEKKIPTMLSELSRQGRKMTVTGTVVRVFERMDGSLRITLKSEGVKDMGRWMKTRGLISLTVYRWNFMPKEGERICFKARLIPFKNFKNPGARDYAGAMKAKGFSSAAYIRDGRGIVPLGRGDLSLLQRLMKRLRTPVRSFFVHNLDENTDLALFQALILGEKEKIRPETREIFNRTGLGHTLTVSGLHIGLVAWVCFFLFKKTLLLSYRAALALDVKRVAALATCVTVVLYALVAGYGISTQRAMIMTLIFLFSIIIGREADIFSTLALAGLVILAMDPQALFSISFQLSFCAVAGILWLVPPLLERLNFVDMKGDNFTPVQRGLVRVLYYLMGIFAVSVCATFFLLPLTAFYFHRISLVSIPANLCVVPILGLWVLPLGLLSVALLPLSQHAASLVLHCSAIGLHLILWVTRTFSGFPWASIWTWGPDLFEIFLFYLLLASLYFYKRTPWARLALFLLLAVIASDTAYWIKRTRFNPDLVVTFLDAGSRNIALVEFPLGKRMIIDGGSATKNNLDVGRQIVAPFLWSHKTGRIDYLVRPTSYEVYYNNLDFVIGTFHPRIFPDSGSGEKEGKSSCIKNINGVVVEKIFIPHCTEGPEPFALKLSFKGSSFIFILGYPFDDGFPHELKPRLTSTVLFLPAWAKRTQEMENLLKGIRARFTVIPHLYEQSRSCLNGKWGMHHHIGRILCLDRTGAVKFSVGKGGMRVATTCQSPPL